MIEGSRGHEGAPPLSIARVDLDAVIEQELQHVPIVVRRRDHERRLAGLRPGVRVGAGVDQCLQRLRVSVRKRGRHQDRPTVVLVRRRQLGARIQQRLDHVRVLVGRGSAQRRLTVVVSRVRIRTCVEQRVDNRDVPVGGRSCHQDGLAELVPGVDVGACIEQCVDDVDVLVVGGSMHQRRLAAAIARVQIGPGVEQDANDVGVLVEGGGHQSGLSLLGAGHHLGPTVEQRLRYRRVRIEAGGRHQSRLATLDGLVDRHSGGEQRTYDLGIGIEGGRSHQRGVAARQGALHVTVVDHLGNDVQYGAMAGHRASGKHLVIAACGSLSPGSEQRPNDRGVGVEGSSEVEGRPTVPVAHRHIGAGSEQRTHHVRVRVVARDVHQRRRVAFAVRLERRAGGDGGVHVGDRQIRRRFRLCADDREERVYRVALRRGVSGDGNHQRQRDERMRQEREARRWLRHRIWRHQPTQHRTVCVATRVLGKRTKGSAEPLY